MVEKRDALSGQTPFWWFPERRNYRYRWNEPTTHLRISDAPEGRRITHRWHWVTSVPEKEDSGMLVFGLHSGEVRVGGGEKGIDQFSAQP